jgi:type IV pilus assembly protein PilN
MLVEINLLPKKERKNRTLLLVSIVIVSLLLSATTLIYFLNGNYNSKISKLNNTLTVTQKTLEEKQKANAEEKNTSTDSYSILEGAVKWAEAYPIKTVPVLRKLTSLLPTTGQIQTFSYNENGEVLLTVQFETSRDAASYLNSLLTCNWVTESKLRTLSANKIILPVYSSSSIDIEGDVEPSTENEIETEDTNTEVHDDNTVVNDAKENNNNSSKVTEYIPRYTAKYEIILNRSVILKEVKKSSQEVQ